LFFFFVVIVVVIVQHIKNTKKLIKFYDASSRLFRRFVPNKARQVEFYRSQLYIAYQDWLWQLGRKHFLFVNWNIPTCIRLQQQIVPISVMEYAISIPFSLLSLHSFFAKNFLRKWYFLCAAQECTEPSNILTIQQVILPTFVLAIYSGFNGGVLRVRHAYDVYRVWEQHDMDTLDYKVIICVLFFPIQRVFSAIQRIKFSPISEVFSFVISLRHNTTSFDML
jgi:hypothetical protein